MSFALAALSCMGEQTHPHGPSACSTQASSYCVCQPHWSQARIFSGIKGKQMTKTTVLICNQESWLNIKRIHGCIGQIQQHDSPELSAAGIRHVQHLGNAAHKIWTGYCIPHDISRKQPPSFLESVTLHKQITTEMPCQPLQRVKNVRIRRSLILNLDYSNPEAALQLQITSIPAPAMKDNGTFCSPRTDSTAQ